jgi:hypothetical protein
VGLERSGPRSVREMRPHFPGPPEGRDGSWPSGPVRGSPRYGTGVTSAPMPCAGRVRLGSQVPRGLVRMCRRSWVPASLSCTPEWTAAIVVAPAGVNGRSSQPDAVRSGDVNRGAALDE